MSEITKTSAVFPSKLLRFAEWACGVSAPQQRNRTKLGFFLFFLLLITQFIQNDLFFLKKHFSPPCFFKRTFFLTRIDSVWQLVFFFFYFWHGHFWAVHHPARIQIPSRPPPGPVSERDPRNQRSISASVAAEWGWRSRRSAVRNLSPAFTIKSIISRLLLSLQKLKTAFFFYYCLETFDGCKRSLKEFTDLPTS